MNRILDCLRASGRVETIDDERSNGNGIIVTLREGWSFDPLQDNRVAGADTPEEARILVNSAHQFNGPYDP